MVIYQKFKEASLEAICAVLGDTSSGLTGREIGQMLQSCNIPDVESGRSKQGRLYEALNTKQNADDCSNNIIHFIQVSISPQRFISSPARFNKFKTDLNKALAFEGYELGDDGLMRKRSHTATSLNDVISQATSAHDLSLIFENRDFEPDPTLVFLLIPLKPPFKRIYDEHVRPPLAALGYRAISADMELKTGVVIEQIWESINRAKVIIADVTGRNPNVFYELGLAHAIRKKCIIVTQDETDVPFDIKHLRYLKYSDNAPGWKKFVEDLSMFMHAFEK